MDEGFFRFPHTPHLLWLGGTPPRVDKVLSPEEVAEFLGSEVVVEEKVDGANVGFSLDVAGDVQVQNRGGYIGRSAHPQFQPLWPWLDTRRQRLADFLKPNLILFGEWCFAVHTVRYECLPDWFLGFDVYDCGAGRFWSAPRRDRFLKELDVFAVPSVAHGRFTVAQLTALLGASSVGGDLVEGLYIRRDAGEWLAARAKLVRPDFAQQITEHWKSRPLERNALAAAVR